MQPNMINGGKRSADEELDTGVGQSHRSIPVEEPDIVEVAVHPASYADSNLSDLVLVEKTPSIQLMPRGRGSRAVRGRPRGRPRLIQDQDMVDAAPEAPNTRGRGSRGVRGRPRGATPRLIQDQNMEDAAPDAPNPAPAPEVPVAAPEVESPAAPAAVEVEEDMEIVVEAVPEVRNYVSYISFSNDSSDISDFTIVVENHRFYVDKRKEFQHLTRHSTILGAMISSPDIQNATLVLENVKEAPFHWFLEVINGVYHSLKAENIEDVLELVTRWKARYAKWACGDFIRRCPLISIKKALELAVQHELKAAKTLLVRKIQSLATLEQVRDSEIIFTDPVVLGLLFNKAMELAGATPPARLQGGLEQVDYRNGHHQQNGINQNHRYNDPNHPRAPTPPRPRMPTPPPPYHPRIEDVEMGSGRSYSRSPSPRGRHDRRYSSSESTFDSEYSESYSDDSRPRRRRHYYSDTDYSMSPESRRRDRRDHVNREERRGRDHRSRSRSPRW
ncbi:hypothetical protein CRE_30406 [Caenorhabditis remanei]|uniref:BTB domain-containing protein n=1 Tax=Caenorhabditis remanei TaxID=31234 RepID=E3NAH4_CAERE|nr:hypothetical protein CRE_30406 [Caenorhabditis remanei]